MEQINNLVSGGAVEDILFYVFAALTLLCAILVVANPFSRNPVTSAMFLVLTIISMSGLFLLLHAFFLAAVQILVYAGAVMVLFLFVIMLLDLKEEQRRRIKFFGLAAGLVSVGLVVSIFIKSLASSEHDQKLVKAIISMAHDLGYRVVAEGIENHEAYDMLASWQCDQAQGYLIAHPLTTAAMGDWLKAPGKGRHATA